MPITHAKVSGEPDGLNTALIQPTDWNADHDGIDEAAHDALDHSGLPGVGGGSGGLAIYGDGHHGDVVFDGVAEIEGATLDAGDYTLTATLYADDMTIEAGVTVNAHHWPIYARGTLTNDGVIASDGAAGGGDGPVYGAILSPGGYGGAGGSDDDGLPGVVTYLNGLGGGFGGKGGDTSSHTGGLGEHDADVRRLLQRSALGGGAVIATTNQIDAPDALASVRVSYAGGSSGGGGAREASVGQGGNGGDGGGVVLIAARLIVNNGTIRALGGAGQDSTSPATATWSAATPFDQDTVISPLTPNGHIYIAVNGGTSDAAEPVWPIEDTVMDNDIEWNDVGVDDSGGGGGAQGGLLVLIYDQWTGDVPDPAVDCAGGLGGDGLNGGDDGTAGDDGLVVTIANA